MGTKIRPINLHTSVDTHIQGLIDSSFVQARSSGGTDSASTQAMIDSNFTNMNKVMSFPDGGSGIDSAKLTFGNDSDFKIYHDGSRTILHDEGTGEIQFRTGQLRIRNPGNTETLAKFVQDGAAELYHGMGGSTGSEKKFETTTYGSTVTGTINADSATFGGGITVTGGNTGDVLLTFATDRSWQFQQAGDDAQTQLQLKANTDSKIFSIANNNGDNDFFFFTSHTGTPYLYIGEDAQIRFEGATANDYETILTVTDPTADNTITLPDSSGTVALTSDITVTASSTTTLTNKTLTNPTINGATLSGTFGGTANLTGLVLAGSSPLKFEGSNDDANETSLAVQNPTADRTITLPDMTGSIKELLISEGSMNATELVFNSGTITSEYSELRLVLSNCKPSANGQTVNFRVGSGNSQDTGSNYGQAIYYSGYYGSTSAYSINTVSATQSLFYLATGYAALGTGTGQNAHFEITFLNPNTSSHYKLFKINSQVYSYYPMLMGRYIDAAVWKSTAAINYIRVWINSGNLALEYKLYGVKS